MSVGPGVVLVIVLVFVLGLGFGLGDGVSCDRGPGTRRGAPCLLRAQAGKQSARGRLRRAGRRGRAPMLPARVC